jgi:hypothetical protein
VGSYVSTGSLDDRAAPVPLGTAIWFLVLGSVLGIALRLGNDQISALMPIRRRQRSVERRFAAWTSLPLLAREADALE